MADPPTQWQDCPPGSRRAGCECRTCSPERYPGLFDAAELPPENVTVLRKVSNGR